MRLSGQNRILAGFAVAVISAALLAGCKDSASPTEPKLAATPPSEITIFNDSESRGNPMGQLHLYR